jgi:hypothetical protein
VGAFGKERVDQAVVQFEMEVGAAILDDDEAAVGVGGFESRGRRWW